MRCLIGGLRYKRSSEISEMRKSIMDVDVEYVEG